MNKSKYKIGDFVLVHNTVEFVYDSNNNRQVELRAPSEPFVAQITGATYRQLGKLIVDIRCGEFGEDYIPAHLACISALLVWKVKRGITNSEIDVLEDGIELCWIKHKLPWRYLRKTNG